MQSPLQVVFKGMESSDAIDARIRERAARLERFYRRLTSCRVVIEADHRSAEGFKPPIAIQIEAHIPKHTLIAKESQNQRDMKNDRLAFVNRAFDAIQRQLEDEAKIMRGDVKQHESARRAPE